MNWPKGIDPPPHPPNPREAVRSGGAANTSPTCRRQGWKRCTGAGAPGKSGDALRAAVLRAADALGKVCGIAGRPVSAIRGWLWRLKREGLGRRHDQKSPVMRRSLTPTQEGAIKEDLGKAPSESGFERGSWNSKLLAKLIHNRLGIICSRKTAPKVAARLGFSTRKPRPAPRNGATAEE